MNELIEAKTVLESARYDYSDGNKLLSTAYQSQNDFCQASFLYLSVAKKLAKGQDMIYAYLLNHSNDQSSFEDNRSLYNAYLGLSPKIIEFEEIALDFDIEDAMAINIDAVEYAIGILSNIEMNHYRISVA